LGHASVRAYVENCLSPFRPPIPANPACLGIFLSKQQADGKGWEFACPRCLSPVPVLVRLDVRCKCVHAPVPLLPVKRHCLERRRLQRLRNLTLHRRGTSHLHGRASAALGDHRTNPAAFDLRKHLVNPDKSQVGIAATIQRVLTSRSPGKVVFSLVERLHFPAHEKFPLCIPKTFWRVAKWKIACPRSACPRSACFGRSSRAGVVDCLSPTSMSPTSSTVPRLCVGEKIACPLCLVACPHYRRPPYRPRAAQTVNPDKSQPWC
jgi:hypothetical protein